MTFPDMHISTACPLGVHDLRVEFICALWERCFGASGRFCK